MRRLLFFGLLIALTTPSVAQSLLLPDQAVARFLQERLPADAYGAVGNGGRLTARQAGSDGPYHLGRASAVLVVLAALAAERQGMIDRADPVAKHLPASFRFDAALFATLRLDHLITQTGGLAAPGPALLAPDAPADPDRLARHAIRLRAPGRARAFDPLGIALLSEILTRRTDQKLPTLLQDLADLPAAPGQDRTIGLALQPALGLTAGPAILDALAARLSDPDRPDARALSRRRGAIAPAAPGWSDGLAERPLGGARAFLIDPAPGGSGALIALFPDAEVSLVLAGLDAETAGPLARAFARRFLLPSRDGPPAPDEAAPAVEPGRYARIDGAQAGLAAAALGRPRQAIHLQAGPDGLVLEGRPLAPDARGTLRLPDGQAVYFGTGRASAYLQSGDRLYVRRGLLAEPALMLRPLLPAVLIGCSLALFLVWPDGEGWRRLARIGLAGLAAFLAGAGLEGAFYQPVWLERGWWLPVLAWRLLFNAGLIALAAVPLIAMGLSRRQAIPFGPYYGLLGLHLSAVTVASLYLVLVSFGWGLAGSLRPSIGVWP